MRSSRPIATSCSCATSRRFLALSRQPLPTLDRSKYASAAGVAKGAYVLADPPGGAPEIILIATGSELSLVVDAHEVLVAQGIKSRVVSMPSWDIFEDQPQDYRDSVLLPRVAARIAVEQGSTLGWERYVGPTGRVIGMKTFGASAPLKELQRHFGFEPDRVVALAKELLGRKRIPKGENAWRRIWTKTWKRASCRRNVTSRRRRRWRPVAPWSSSARPGI